MRSAIVLVAEAGQGTAPDLTRYFVVCAGSILGLLALAWVFRRFVAGRLKARAARRSLQVLDVLPLSGKQKLVVVRCYDRSFLLGVGEKEVRSIAELDAGTARLQPGPGNAGLQPGSVSEEEPRWSVAVPAFSEDLERELTVRPAQPRAPSRDLHGGLLA